MRRNRGIDPVVLARGAGRGAALVPLTLSLLLIPVACNNAAGGMTSGTTTAGVTGTGGATSGTGGGTGGATSGTSGGTGGATSGTGGGTSEHHAMCGMPYDPDPRDATMSGEFIRIVTDKGDEADPADDKYDLRLPTEMYDWLKEQNWIQEHGDWHNVRRWDQGCKLSGSSDGSCPSADAMKARGLSRAPIQEGTPGDGYAFLVMHRHMIRGFKEAFPKHAALLDGFKKVPLTQSDPENPLPWVDIHWSDDQLAEIKLLQDIEHNLDLFESEDDLGTWIQLGAGGFPPGGFPPGGFPSGASSSSSSTTATSSTTNSSSAGSGGGGGAGGADGAGGAGGGSTGPKRPPGGIHGALHGQWAVPNSPFSLINNDVNLPLVAFWRLHGWIDDMWERYRVAKGIGEDDPTYKAEMMAQCEDMHELGKATPPTSTTGPLFPPETGVFAEKVAPIFNTYCMGCHGAVAASKGLVLSGVTPSKVRAGLVGVKSSEVEMPIVDPGSPSTSWLIHKLTGDFTGITCNECTTAMPPAGVKPTDDQIETIRAWIKAGATAD